MLLMELENMKEDFLSYEKYEEICKHEGVTDDESQNILVDFLNDLGVILHFNDPALKETNVINPEWATEAVYKIINYQKLADSNGILLKPCLKQILDKSRYPVRRHDFIIELMIKFELCFPLKEDIILVPGLLAEEEPEFKFDYDSAIKYLIQYDFLPKSVLTSFIVRMYRDIKNELCWRTGVVLEDILDDCTTVVKVDERDKKLYVYVNGAQKREYFPFIRKVLHEINNTFEKIGAKEMVPCNCRDCAFIPKPYFFEYPYLIKSLKKKKSTVRCQKSIEDVYIEDLLTGIKREDEEGDYKWDVFISYSRKDSALIKKITEDFKRYRISHWWDEEQMHPGVSIITSIEEALLKSRFVMPCFSQKQLKSGWSRAECDVVLNRILSGDSEQEIIPLILDDLSPKHLPPLLSNFKWVKYSDKQGYKEILKRLRK